MNREILNKQVVKSFHGKRIAVIGDIMLDRFLSGNVIKKSPEANAPVVLWKGEDNILGGAGNVAANIQSLGGTAELFSVIGEDRTGAAMKNLLNKSKIFHKLIIEHGRTSTLKIRIFADGKYLLRLDQEVKNHIPKTISTELLNNIKKKISSFDALIFSDYDKGVLSKELVMSIISLAERHHLPIIADVKPKNAMWFKNVTVIKPNAKEAAEMGGSTNVVLAAQNIGKKLSSNVLVTRGARGMALCLKGRRRVISIEGIKTKVKDIVGAGDVVSACLSLALASKISIHQASILANMAATLSVEKHGTTTVSMQELINEVAN